MFAPNRHYAGIGLPGGSRTVLAAVGLHGTGEPPRSSTYLRASSRAVAESVPASLYLTMTGTYVATP